MAVAAANYEPIPLSFERLDEDDQLRRSRAFLETMAKRRSCRFFSRDDVNPELIVNAVKAAGSAPSGANQQPWTFVVVRDPRLKTKIRTAAEEEERAFYDHGSARWLAAIAPLGTDAVKEHITDAPYVIVVFAQLHGVCASDDKATAENSTPTPTTIKHYYVRESVGIACGLLLASLTHAGLVTLPHTPSPMGFLSTLLGRPENERAVLLVPVGYPAANATVPKHALEKKSIDEILIWR